MQKPSAKACLQLDHFWVPIVAFLLVVGLFVGIIIISDVDRVHQTLPWRKNTVIGDAFRLRVHQVVIPIIRYCQGPKLELWYYTGEDNSIASTRDIVTYCDTTTPEWPQGSPYEVSLQILATSTKKMRVIVDDADFIDIPVVDRLQSNFAQIPSADVAVCVLPSTKPPLQTSSNNSAVPEVHKLGIFLESWLHMGASLFYVYDMSQRKNKFKGNSYGHAGVEWPMLTEKEVLQTKFPNASLFYALDCLYRSRFAAKWTILTTIEDIAVVRTQESLLDVLAELKGTTEANHVAFHLQNGQTQHPSALIFDPVNVVYFDSTTRPVFQESTGSIIDIDAVTIATLSYPELQIALSQENESSPMNQLFSQWTESLNSRIIGRKVRRK